MCFVMFKFSMQQLLRKKKSYITTVLLALFTLIPIVGVQQDLRFWLSLKAGAGQGTKPVVLGRERSASLDRGLLCPAGALPAAGKLWRVLRPLCPACPSLLWEARPSTRHVPNELDTEPGGGSNLWEQTKAEGVGKGSIVLFEDTCVKALYCPSSVDGKRPFMKRHFCFIYSSQKFNNYLCSSFRAKSFFGHCLSSIMCAQHQMLADPSACLSPCSPWELMPGSAVYRCVFSHLKFHMYQSKPSTQQTCHNANMNRDGAKGTLSLQA